MSRGQNQGAQRVIPSATTGLADFPRGNSSSRTNGSKATAFSGVRHG